jgi:hypothetical protein
MQLAKVIPCGFVFMYGRYGGLIAMTCGLLSEGTISLRFLETFHTAFVWAYIYELAVINFNNPAGLTQAGWSLAFSVLTHGALSFLVQVGYLALNKFD